METSKLNHLLTFPISATKADMEELQELSNQDVYAQFLHILVAKIGALQNVSSKSALITRAAVYSANRAVLKDLITRSDYWPAPNKTLSKYSALTQPRKIDDQKPKNTSTSDELYQEVFKNLEKLKSLRQQFAYLEEKKAHQGIEVSIEQNVKPQSGDDKSTENITGEDDKSVDEILDQITQKAELPPKDERKKQQLDIINNFINNMPDFSSRKRSIDEAQDEENTDLSENSAAFNDDIISENLALIFLKQGKKDKAIDIYRKLIWKYPDKKPYFVARIEALKEN
ncbi:MAG: tetratricopeptide repeat protein [Cyclobacteriaceae bacterium]|nr:tetratricopeptide repeat protein [Cyclobacteriaceae bacterium]